LPLPFTGKFRRFLPKGLPPLSEQEIMDEQQPLRSIQAANLSVKTGKTYGSPPNLVQDELFAE
jgi:hypothetical protein